MNRKAPLAWAAMLGSLWIVMILGTHWEPVVRDGWSNLNWYRWHKLDLDVVWGFIRDGWLGSNPRLGQTLTTLLYAPGPYHVIVTPVLELGLLYVMAAVALGRWPSLRRTDDALVFATTTAIFAACTPQFGPMLFYRPFMGNYTFGLLLNLLWLVPYRLHVTAPRSWRLWWAPLLLVLGVAAGMCNEHTGPAFLGLGLAVVVWSVREGHGIKPWMIAGLLGLAVGYVLLILAPGHGARYGGLAKEAGILGRIVERGVGENLRIVVLLPLYLLWSVPWIALAIVARRRTRPAPMSPIVRRALWALAAAGLLATLALLGSPKLGPRLYVHSVGLISIALAGAVVSQLGAPWARKACAGLSIAVLLYVEARLVITYRTVSAVSAERIAIINKGPLRTTVVVPLYPYKAGKWFLGEDFASESLRASVAADYGLTKIDLAPN